jgi:hypothetical protein
MCEQKQMTGTRLAVFAGIVDVTMLVHMGVADAHLLQLAREQTA